MAPTYTIKKIKAKKSKLSKRRRPAELQNTKIKKRTEYTGFLDRITKKAENSTKNEKNKNKNVSPINIFFSEVSKRREHTLFLLPLKNL